MDLPYHIETPLRSPSNLFNLLRGQDKIFGLEVRRRRDFNYTDTYWDTPSADLHADGISLRTRYRVEGKIDFLVFKGQSSYILPNVFARQMATEVIETKVEAVEKLAKRAPSQPITALYSARPDLVAAELKSTCSIRVDRRNVDLHDKSGRGVCTLSFHTFTTDKSSDENAIIELQPFCKAPVVAQVLTRIFGIVIERAEQEGITVSPVGKYQRLTREVVESAK